MTVTIEQARRQVERCLKAAAAIGTKNGRAATEAEKEVWGACWELGLALMTQVFARAAAAKRLKRYVHEGRPYEIVGQETLEVGTRFGKVKVFQPVGRSVDGGGPRDLPLMRELGLPAGFTLPVVTLFGKLCSMMAFAQGRELFSSLFGWTPSPRAVLRMVDATGKEARPYLEQAPAPEDDGEVLVIEVDGKGAPAISSREYERRTQPRVTRRANHRHARRLGKRKHPRVRRAPGKKSKNAKVAAVGVLYTLKRQANGQLEGPFNKRVYATFESYRALYEWLHAEATKRGYGTKKFTQVLFLADGAQVIWALKKEFFSDALECLDWYHVVEKLWDAGTSRCRGTRRHRDELEAWVASMKKALRGGKVQDVISNIRTTLRKTPVTGPGNKFRREVISRVLEYFTVHAARMNYKQLRNDDLPIGSGVVEGAARHLVGVRLDGPGMRWSRDRSEAVLHLRCVLINGDWPAFEAFLAKQSAFRLRSQPVPTRTHDAKLQMAA